MSMMTSKERITRQALGQEVDRVPLLGGWIGGAANLAELGEMPLATYLADPYAGMLHAHQHMGVDGLVQPVVFERADQVRTGSVMDESHPDVEPEALQEAAEALPDTERAVLADFDAAAAERRYRDYFERAFRTWGDLVPVPNFWEFGGPFPLYTEYGYIAFLSACALYPEAVARLWWARSLPARESAKILVRLYREYDLVPLLFCGEDICNNKGPMVSPEFLRAHYFPLERAILAPFLEGGVRVVRHCDGDIRTLLDDFLAVGYSGFQGFQYELGVDLFDLRERRAADGRELLLFTGLSVTRTLPFGTLEDVREEVSYFFDATQGGRGMFLFTSNVSGVEVPSAVLREAYRYAQTLNPHQPGPHPKRPWPWGLTHP